MEKASHVIESSKSLRRTQEEHYQAKIELKMGRTKTQKTLKGMGGLGLFGISLPT